MSKKKKNRRWRKPDSMLPPGTYTAKLRSVKVMDSGEVKYKFLVLE